MAIIRPLHHHDDDDECTHQFFFHFVAKKQKKAVKIIETKKINKICFNRSTTGHYRQTSYGE